MDCGCMDLAVICGAVERETPLYKGVRRVEVSPDVASWCLATVLLDAEGDVSGTSVMLEACWYRQYRSPSWSTRLCWLRVSGAPRFRYRLGSSTLASTLTLISSTAYTQPFSSDCRGDTEPLGNDMGELVSVVVYWWNLSGILVVLFEMVNEANCQRRGLHTTEVKSRHTVSWNGGPHWDSRGEVKSGVWDDGSVTVTVFSRFSTPSAVSEIIVGG
jgi:hypothetical protein